jgi:hypothetical protein
MNAASRFSRGGAILALLAAGGCAGAALPIQRTAAGESAAVRSGPDSGSDFYGCPPFRANNTYNKVITNASVDPNSAAYIASAIQAGDSSGFYASTGVEQINLANDGTALYTVHPKSKYHQFPVQYPWASGFFIEPSGDGHAMVVQTKSCHLYESYSTSFSDETLSAYSGANWALADKFVPLPAGSPSAMASGLSLFAGMVRWEDYESGSIDHALNWAGIAHTVSQYGFVRPASDTDRLPFYGSSSYELPYGARLRLKASFSTYGWGPQSTMVANAMKTYGIYLADTGSSANGLYFSNTGAGQNPWDAGDLSVLSQLSLNDFDVIELPAIQYVQ